MKPILPTLYLRKELARNVGRRYDVAAYRDAKCTERQAVWPWYSSECPRFGRKYVIQGCAHWRVVWKKALK